MSYVLVFLANILNDILAVAFVIEVNQKHAHRAGAASAAIVTLFGMTACFIVPEPWHLVPAALGAYVGTFFMVKAEEEIRCLLKNLISKIFKI